MSADNHRGQEVKNFRKQAGYMRAMISSHINDQMSCKPGGSIYGHTVLLGISKRGNTYLRTLYIHGARSVLRHSVNKTDRFSLWAQAVLKRRGHNKACIAVANKLARIAWVVMAKGETYTPAV